MHEITCRNARSEPRNMFDRRTWATALGPCGVITIVQAFSMMLAADALAQSSACDQLKSVLAARIEASGVRGYSLEAVPADALVPRDAKAIGNCDAGATKILYRRWGATKASAGAASAAASAAAPPAIAIPDERTRAAPGVQRERTARSVPVPAASPAPQPVARSNEVAAVTLTPTVEKSPKAGASSVEASRGVDRAVVPPAPLIANAGVEVKAPLARRVSEFVAANWLWVGALALLAGAASIWVWRARFSAYDKAGLPRGPRL